MDLEKAASSPQCRAVYQRHEDVAAAPSAPPAELFFGDHPIKQLDPCMAIPTAPELLPPSAMIKRSLLWLTLKLYPYHVLNFVLGLGAFCIVVTGVCLSVGLLPLCCLGVPIYLVLLQINRLLVVMDVALANSITRPQAAARWNVPDEIDQATATAYELRIAPRLARVSVRSTAIVVYFASVKFVVAIASVVSVCLPVLPIVSQIVASTTSDSSGDSTSIAGYDVHAFNLGTNALLYFLTCVGYIVVGVCMMHVLGVVSRETTRRVCCKEIKPTSRGGSTNEA